MALELIRTPGHAIGNCSDDIRWTVVGNRDESVIEKLIIEKLFLHRGMTKELVARHPEGVLCAVIDLGHARRMPVMSAAPRPSANIIETQHCKIGHDLVYCQLSPELQLRIIDKIVKV